MPYLKQVYVKVKVTQWYAYIGTEGRRRYSSNPFVTSVLEGGGWSAPRSGRFTPGKDGRYPLYRRLGGSHGWSGRVWKISSSPRFDPRTVEPVTTRYADWAIPATSSSYTKAYLYGGLRSIWGQSMWDLWCAKWQWDKFYSKRFVFPMPTIIPPMLTYHHIWLYFSP